MFNIRLFLITVLAYLAAGMSPLYAEEQAEISDTPASATSAEAEDSDAEGTKSLEVERILKLETTQKIDKKNLKEIRKSLSGRTKILKKLQEALERIAARLDDRKAKLGKAKEKGDTKQIARLEKEIQRLEGDYELIKKQAQLAFEAEKTIRSQIELLEKSIVQQQEVLDELKGRKKRPVAPLQPPVPAVSKPDESAQPTPLTPVQKMISETAPPPIADKTGQAEDHLRTAEQVEARQQAEKRLQEALQAEQVAVGYIEQKSAFLEQIRLDKVLLKTDIESLENYDRLLRLMEERLGIKAKEGAGREELNRQKNNIGIVKREIQTLKKQVQRRRASLGSAQKHLKQLEEDQEALAEEARKKREEAEQAQKRVVWLQSPLHPRNLLTWMLTRGPRVLLVLIIMALALVINRITANKISRVMARKSLRKGKMSQNRADTLALSFRGAARVVIIFGGMLIALQEAGVDIKTVLGGAAILGFAIAFGAQNLMRDYFNGFMILLEDQYELKDIVTINNITGTVERVSMRTTMLRDLNGNAHFIPNGSITSVTNTTYEWSRAVLDIPVAYKENVDRVMSVILELANELRQDSEFGPYIMADPIMLGVNSFDESAVTIKFMLQTRADKMWPIRREMLRRIKNRFDELGIEFVLPRRAITQSKDEE